MESQSMRRRQTVLGELLPGFNGSQPSLAAVSTRSGPNINLAGGPMSNGTAVSGSGSNPSLVPSSMAGLAPSAQDDTSLTFSQRVVHNRTSSFAQNSTASGNAPSASLGANLGTNLANHRRSFSRMSSRMTAGDDYAAVGDGSSVRSAKLDHDELDPVLLSGPIDPAQYLSRSLAGVSAEGVLRFGEVLKQQAARAAELEQRSAQHNQTSLTAIASGVAQLAPAVAELRRRVADLGTVTDAIRQDALAAQTDAALSQRRTSVTSDDLNGGSNGGGINGGINGVGDNEEEEAVTANSAIDRRQSMLVLNAAWAHGLNELFQRVDGLRAALPPTPNRHLVLEEGGWLELNPVTHRPVKPVLLVLLSDYAVLAAQHSGRWAHEWHTSLDEPIELAIDEKHKTLRVAQFGLLAPSLARLRAVYAELCKVNELASQGPRVSRQITKRRSQRRSRQASGNGSVAGSSASVANTTAGTSAAGRRRNHSRKASHASVSSLTDIPLEQRREGARVVAEIDAAVAARRFSEAAELVLEYTSDALVGAVVAQRGEDLAQQLLAQVRDIAGTTKEELGDTVELLIRLGRATEAKTTMLDAAAVDIEEQARQVHFMGDVASYISQMAAIYFQSINATVSVFRQAFPERRDSSFVVAWTKSQVDIYAAIFNRQLFRIAPEFQAYQRCREVSRLESSQLREQKLDMDFMLRYVWES